MELVTKQIQGTQKNKYRYIYNVFLHLARYKILALT